MLDLRKLKQEGWEAVDSTSAEAYLTIDGIDVVPDPESEVIETEIEALKCKLST